MIQVRLKASHYLKVVEDEFIRNRQVTREGTQVDSLPQAQTQQVKHRECR